MRPCAGSRSWWRDYQGPEELEFILHLKGELGLEKDDFAFMSQVITVDHALAVGVVTSPTASAP